MKKVFLMFLLALGVGSVIAYFIFYKVKMDEFVPNDVSVKAFQVGAFTNYDNAIRVAERNNGIVVSDGDIFRVFVAVLYDQKAIDKLINYYEEIGLNYYLKDVKVSDKFIKDISKSEELLVNSSADTYSVINLSVLSKFKEFV